jgi:hypothetical protein
MVVKPQTGTLRQLANPLLPSVHGSLQRYWSSGWKLLWRHLEWPMPGIGVPIAFAFLAEKLRIVYCEQTSDKCKIFPIQQCNSTNTFPITDDLVSHCARITVQSLLPPTQTRCAQLPESYYIYFLNKWTSHRVGTVPQRTTSRKYDNAPY